MRRAWARLERRWRFRRGCRWRVSRRPKAADLAQAVWALPIAGLVVGIVGAVVYALGASARTAAVARGGAGARRDAAVTGALHEDGLADTADGFGGGAAREQKLAIMRDSRIGTYGVCALVLRRCSCARARWRRSPRRARSPRR